MTPEKNRSIKNEVNKAKLKVAKTFLRVGLATSMIFGASACVPTEAIFTTPTPEVSPLPSDLTKTPALSPIEAPVELTPTVENPATQGSALTFSSEIGKFVDHEWIVNLLDRLGDEYYYDDKYKSIWFIKNNNDGTSERRVPVLIFDFENSVTFQEGVDGGRETVRYASFENVKVSLNGILSLVGNYYGKNYSFSEVNMAWWENNE